jgi:hypothetical protein
MSIKKEAEKNITDIFNILNEVDLDAIKSEGISLRAGNKIFKLEVSLDQDLAIEDEIRNELKAKLSDRIKIIREKVNEKITEVSNFVNTIKIEYDRKEKDLKEQLKNATPMPNVNISHAKNGLSVVKGKDRNTLQWLVQGIFWPKYMDKKPLDKKFSKKLLSNVIFLIKTNGDKIVSVETRQPIGLNLFQHYHQQLSGDCWGNWNPIRKWNSPNDIIKCAREAEAVLENINTASIAINNPRGMPRRDTVSRHIINPAEENKLGILNQATKRSGITENIRDNDSFVWNE